MPILRNHAAPIDAVRVDWRSDHGLDVLRHRVNLMESRARDVHSIIQRSKHRKIRCINGTGINAAPLPETLCRKTTRDQRHNNTFTDTNAWVRALHFEVLGDAVNQFHK